MADVKAPLPVVPDYEQPFWEGAQRGELLLQQCASCSSIRSPMSPICPDCLSEEVEWVPSSGRGTVESWIVYRQAFHPAFIDALPYNVAWIALEEGPRLTSNIVGVEFDDLHIGMPVEVVFEEANEEITLPRFRPAS